MVVRSIALLYCAVVWKAPLTLVGACALLPPHRFQRGVELVAEADACNGVTMRPASPLQRHAPQFIASAPRSIDRSTFDRIDCARPIAWLLDLSKHLNRSTPTHDTDRLVGYCCCKLHTPHTRRLYQHQPTPKPAIMGDAVPPHPPPAAAEEAAAAPAAAAAADGGEEEYRVMAERMKDEGNAAFKAGK